MRPEEFMQLIRARPFIPLRIHLTGGQTYEIRHPDQVLVLRSRVVIGLEPDPATGILGRTEHFALLHVVRVEELQQASTGNGA
jgi:hypothetical protein